MGIGSFFVQLNVILNSKCHRVWEFHNWAWWWWRLYYNLAIYWTAHLNIFKRLWQYQLFLELSVHESFNIVFSSSRSITFVCVFVVFFGFEETWLMFNICMTPPMCLCLSLCLCLWKPSWCSLFMWHHLCLSCPSQRGAKPDGPTLIAFENYIENYEGKLYWRNLSENYSAGSS